MALILHDSDCSLHSAPAFPVGPCDCGAEDVLHLLNAYKNDQLEMKRPWDAERADEVIAKLRHFLNGEGRERR
jgi:hypothetical protein